MATKKDKNITQENQQMMAFENTSVDTEETKSASLMDDFTSGLSDEETAIDFDTSDTYDEIIHPTGKEVRCIVHDVVVGTDDESGKPKWWMITLEDADDPHVKRFKTFVSFPLPQDDVRKKNNKKKAWAAFKAAFGIPAETPVKPSDMIGKEAWAILNKTEDPQYGEQNSVKQWVQPKGGAVKSGF